MLAEEAQMSAQLSAQQQVVLDELRAQYQITNRATENLDGKLAGLFSVASLLLTLFTGLQDTAVRALPYVFVPYPVLVILLLVALWPRRMSSPIKLEWKAVCTAYLGADEQEAYRQLISDYVYAIDDNLAHNCLKARLLIASFLLVVLQTVIFVIVLY
jgi:hypothetical protein